LGCKLQDTSCKLQAASCKHLPAQGSISLLPENEKGVFSVSLGYLGTLGLQLVAKS